MIRLLLASLLLASPAGAAVFSRDLFEPGDGLLTYDDVNQREWLDFSVTSGLSLPDLEAMTASSGVLKGFVGATREDIEDLRTSGDPSSWPIGNDRDWIELLGLVGNIADGDLFSIGFGAQRYTGGRVAFVHPDTQLRRFSDHTVLLSAPLKSNGWFILTPYLGGFLTEVGQTTPPDPLGQFHPPGWSSYWLYREAAPVPEPTGLCVAVAACLAPLRLRALA